MEQRIDTTKPRPCVGTERRLRQNLMHSYRRGVIMSDAVQYFATTLLLAALSAMVLATCFPLPSIASSDRANGGHLVQLFEKTIPVS